MRIKLCSLKLNFIGVNIFFLPSNAIEAMCFAVMFASPDLLAITKASSSSSCCMAGGSSRSLACRAMGSLNIQKQIVARKVSTRKQSAAVFHASRYGN